MKPSSLGAILILSKKKDLKVNVDVILFFFIEQQKHTGKVQKCITSSCLFL